jgi:hypothetical protein
MPSKTLRRVPQERLILSFVKNESEIVTRVINVFCAELRSARGIMRRRSIRQQGSILSECNRAVFCGRGCSVR